MHIDGLCSGSSLAHANYSIPASDKIAFSFNVLFDETDNTLHKQEESSRCPQALTITQREESLCINLANL